MIDFAEKRKLLAILSEEILIWCFFKKYIAPRKSTVFCVLYLKGAEKKNWVKTLTCVHGRRSCESE